MRIAKKKWSLLCVDWQRYSKRFQEDIRNTIEIIRIRLGGVFQMPVSGEVWDHREGTIFIRTKKNLGLAPNMEWSSTNSFCFTTQ